MGAVLAAEPTPPGEEWVIECTLRGEAATRAFRVLGAVLARVGPFKFIKTEAQFSFSFVSQANAELVWREKDAIATEIGVRTDELTFTEPKAHPAPDMVSVRPC
jgi:hypothetical protein